MSWHYSRGQAAESSEDCCTGGELLPPLRSKITHAEFYCNGKLTESYLDSLSGTMYAPLTEPSGEEGSMSSAEASRAKISVAPGKVLALLEQEAVYGVRWRESFAKLDRDTSSWKTRQCLLLGGLESFSETWPKWGMMRDGECSERVMPVLPTSGTGSGYWRTPNASDGEGGIMEMREGASGHYKLRDHVMPVNAKMWPTPSANEDATGTPDGKMQWMLTQAAKSGCTTRKEYKDGGTKTRQTWPTPTTMDHVDRKKMRPSRAATGRTTGYLSEAILPKMWRTPTAAETKNQAFSNQIYLQNQVGAVPKKWPTPTQSDGMGGPGNSGRAGGENLRTQCKGQLNPSWVEWLMGWPIGWTDLRPLEMDRFRAWLRSHGI